MEINIPPEDIEKIVQSVWCTTCVKPTIMKNYSAKAVHNGIILEGQCSRCQGFVSRFVEVDVNQGKE